MKKCMMHLHSQKLRKFFAAQTGAAAIEFAICGFAFLMLMMAIIEYGMFMLTQITIETAVAQGGRYATIGAPATPGCPDRVCAVTHYIQGKTSSLMRGGAAYIQTQTLTPAGIGVPDICLVDASNPYPSQCVDASGSPGIFIPGGGHAGPYVSSAAGGSVGGAGEIIEIRATYPWRVLFPVMGRFFGQHGVVTISSSTIVKNEPF